MSVYVHGSDSWFRKIPWRRAWDSTPVFSPGESHGLGNLAGYSSWGRQPRDMPQVDAAEEEGWRSVGVTARPLGLQDSGLRSRAPSALPW